MLFETLLRSVQKMAMQVGRAFGIARLVYFNHRARRLRLVDMTPLALGTFSRTSGRPWFA